MLDRVFYALYTGTRLPRRVRGGRRASGWYYGPMEAVVRRIAWAAVLLVLAAGLASGSCHAEAAAGVVYRDANGNGMRDAGEEGLSNVRVSNGREVVRTDEEGRYSVPVTEDTIVFVIKPRGWMTRVDANGLPRFYYIHKPEGSPKLEYPGVEPTGPLPASIDFPLYPRGERDWFRVVFLGDTQVGSEEEVQYLGNDVVQELMGTDAVFGVTLGDIVNDKLDLFDSLNRTVGLIGIPWYNVRGNHDSNYDAVPNRKLVDETFERVYGPSYYSFDYGQVHFIVLDNVEFSAGRRYRAGLDADQMEFLKNDLAECPDEQLVCVMSHIPPNEMRNREQVLGVLSAHPNSFWMAGHWHVHQHLFLDEKDGWNGYKPLHAQVTVTACGSWWTGSKDELGIPHTTMRDGAPNGYSIATFAGSRYYLRFKASRRPPEYQMNISAPEQVKVAEAERTEVLANVFDGSEYSRVEMRLGARGEWAEMAKVRKKDPYYEAVKARPERIPDAGISGHIWRGYLPANSAAGKYMIEVRATDMFGQTSVGYRPIVISEN